jgi:putative DNA primase/helicase
VTLAEQPFTVDIDEAHRKYALAALDGELRELASTPRGGGRHGGRNQAAYMAAHNLGGYVGAGALSERLVRNSLVDVVSSFDPAAFDRHVDAIERGLANGMAKPRDLSAVGTQRARGRGSDRSASPPSPRGDPPEAYSDFADLPGGPAAPGPDAGEGEEISFQNGSGSDASPARGCGGRIASTATTSLTAAAPSSR